MKNVGARMKTLRENMNLTPQAVSSYLDDPCKTSSLPFWKTVQIKLPENIAVIREDEFKEENCEGSDEPYFKLVHYFEKMPINYYLDLFE